MIDLDMIDALEGEVALSQFDYYNVVQAAINDGTAWQLQGAYGRELMAAIENGFCMLGRDAVKDYWGNTIPSRFDVKPGTKGSYEFVVDAMGEDWANDMDAL